MSTQLESTQFKALRFEPRRSETFLGIVMGIFNIVETKNSFPSYIDVF